MDRFKIKRETLTPFLVGTGLIILALVTSNTLVEAVVCPGLGLPRTASAILLAGRCYVALLGAAAVLGTLGFSRVLGVQVKAAVMWLILLSVPLAPFVLMELLFTLQGMRHYATHYHPDDYAESQMVERMDQGRHLNDGSGRVYRPFTSASYNVNSFGFRTREPGTKHPDEWRIGVLGGSTIWGTSVVDSETIPNLLEVRLRAVYGDRVTVYNFGVENSHLADEIEVVKKYRTTFALDQVVFYDGGNDTAWAYNHVLRPERPDGGAGMVADTPMNRVSFAIRRTNTYRVLNSLFLHAFPVRTAPMSPQDYGRLVSSEAATYLGTMRTADTYCRDLGLTCAFFLQPMLDEKPMRTRDEQNFIQSREDEFPGFAKFRRDFMAEVLAGAGSMATDMEWALKDVSEPTFTDNIHLNRYGNRRMAEVIAESLITSGSIPLPEISR